MSPESMYTNLDDLVVIYGDENRYHGDYNHQDVPCYKVVEPG